MSHINQQSQDNKYGQLARKLLKIATLTGSKVVLRHAGQSSDTATEFLHEFGTTDVAIGDATAEVMLTTLGKIPNEMYFLEDTVANIKITTRKNKLQEALRYTEALETSTETIKYDNEYGNHSSVLLALLVALLIILLLCCTTACLIAKAKRKNIFFGKSDMECESGCTGINQPLLDKISDCTNKTSISSMKN